MHPGVLILGAGRGISARQVVGDRVFWFNLAIVLVGTSWVPLVSMDVTSPEGEVARHHVPVYRCYQALFVEPSLLALAAVAIHLTLCFGISFMIRKWMLRAREAA